MLSKSKYCNGIECVKKLWLEKYYPEVMSDLNNDSVFENGVTVGNIAKELLGKSFEVKFDSNLDNMVKDTLALLSFKNIIITEASFKYDDNFCSVDILKKDNDEYEMYEVKSSTSVKDIYIDDVSYQYYVLSNLGLNVKKCFVVYINGKYVRKGDLELNKLFITKDITDEVLEKQDEVKSNINFLNKYLIDEKEPEIDIGMQCFVPYDCPFFNYCTQFLKKPNVFDLRRMTKKKKLKYYYDNIYTYNELLKEDIDDKFKQQIEFELYDKEEYINKEEVKKFLDTLTEPLYFLDFETFQQAVPKYDGISPYMQIPFQYSLHYYENGLKHKEFLAVPGVDPRRELAQNLVKDIPMDTCVLAYNMSFEKTVIKNLAGLFPDLSAHLLNIYSNIKDLMIPFYNRSYYVKEMKGSYSIKYVLPALFPNEADLDYHNLDMIHNGSEAMNSFTNMENLSKEEQEILRNNLLKYCELDTYAMVKIYEKLKEVVK